MEDEHFERELARCRGMDIQYDGWLMMGGVFEYEGSGQGFGYSIDCEFIKLFMEVFGVEHLQDVNGKECWVTHNHSKIILVEPVFKKDGKAFDVKRWAEDAQKRAELINAHREGKLMVIQK